MNGILVTNHFLNTGKFNELHSHIISTAENMGIRIEHKTNLQLATQKVNTDFVLFWDKDINLACRLEAEGLPVFNSSSAIELCDDKARTYLHLLDTVAQPETIIAPKTFFRADMTEFVESAVSILGLPVVFKECFGSFGAQVHLCSTVEEINALVSERPFILQKFVSESAGSDIRLEVVGSRVVSAVKRHNFDDFRSNVTNGGTMEAYTPTAKQCEIAIKACAKLGLDFGGVDILLNNQVCEVNSNAHIINIMNAGGIDIAPMIFERILEKI